GATFMQGFTAANVLDGGAIIDDGGFTKIIIGQSLQAGGTGVGGLTKQGTGTLTLINSSTYTGNTIINAGTVALSTNGNILLPTSGSITNSSNIVVSAGATLDVSLDVA